MIQTPISTATLQAIQNARWAAELRAGASARPSVADRLQHEAQARTRASEAALGRLLSLLGGDR